MIEALRSRGACEDFPESRIELIETAAGSRIAKQSRKKKRFFTDRKEAKIIVAD